MLGMVVKLDRGLPLVQLEDGTRLRCEHATDLVKHEDLRAVIGDSVEVDLPDTHDVGVITRICPRRTEFIRKDPTERTLPQVLAANFDRIAVVQPADRLNLKRLQRELVLAFETGAEVAVILTKADLVDEQTLAAACEQVQTLAGDDVCVMAISKHDEASMQALLDGMGPGTMTVLIGRSGVGKSTLTNALVKRNARQTSEVRETDGKGRHTTVSREVLQIPGAGCVVDMPGVRGLGLWDADEGIETAFADIQELANECRFRDCKHTSEPGCAVRAAVEAGSLSEERLASYLSLRQELAQTAERRRRSSWSRR